MSVRQKVWGKPGTSGDDSEPRNNDFSTDGDLEINLVSCLGWKGRGEQPEALTLPLLQHTGACVEGWADDFIPDLLSSVSGAAVVATMVGLNNGEIRLTWESRLGPQGL